MTGSEGVDGAIDAPTRLRAARERVAELATERGEFHVACASTGASPEPVAGRTFATYRKAAAAAAAARTYRAALRELDPAASTYDLVACEDLRAPVQVSSHRERTDERRPNGLPRTSRTATVTGESDDEWLRVENAPVVHLSRDDEPVGDEAVERQLDAKL